MTQLSDILYPVAPWLEFAAVVLWMLASAMQPMRLGQSIQAIVSPIQRRYVDGNSHPLWYGIRLLFQLEVITLTMSGMVSAIQHYSAPITGAQHVRILLWVVMVMVGKGILDKVIQYTFQYPLHEATYYKNRNDLWQMLCTLMLVVVIMQPWLSDMWMWLLCSLVLIAYWCILGWKLIQAFGLSIEHLCYIAIYLLHMEILPVILMAAGARYVLD